MGYVPQFREKMVAADFNHDAKLDVAVVEGNKNLVTALLGNGNGGFSSIRRFPAGFGPVSVTSGDFNNDGRPDLVVPDFKSKRLSILLNMCR